MNPVYYVPLNSFLLHIVLSKNSEIPLPHLFEERGIKGVRSLMSFITYKTLNVNPSISKKTNCSPATDKIKDFFTL